MCWTIIIKQPPSSSLESTQSSPPHHNTVNTIVIVGRHRCHHQQRTTGITYGCTTPCLCLNCSFIFAVVIYSHHERVICHSTHQTGVDFANSAASSENKKYSCKINFMWNKKKTKKIHFFCLTDVTRAHNHLKIQQSQNQ